MTRINCEFKRAIKIFGLLALFVTGSGVVAESLFNPGNPLPLRRMKVEDGTLLYGDDNTEVALWGINFQTMLSWEYRTRNRFRDFEISAENLRTEADRNLEQVRDMGIQMLRVHLVPADFSDENGTLIETPYLDNLDYVISRCREMGLYLYISLINEMGGGHVKDSFFGRRENQSDRTVWLVDSEAIETQKHYITQLLNRENPYCHLTYKSDPTICMFEIMNEPPCQWQGLSTVRRYPAVMDAYHTFLEQNGLVEGEESYDEYRYQYVTNYINAMTQTIRATGCNKPVCWNLLVSWTYKPKNDRVYQAAADSDADVVSFSLYPHQKDLEEPHWANIKNLSANNYIPLYNGMVTEAGDLHWIFAERFNSKAKVVYEMGAQCVDTVYNYPVMARVLRSAGVQMAGMWTYTLDFYKEAWTAAYFLNTESTPRMAASYAAAGEVFRRSPRFCDLDVSIDDVRYGGFAAAGFSNDYVVVSTPDLYVCTGEAAAGILKVECWPQMVVATGNSSLVSYEGSGLYVVRKIDNGFSLKVNPDVMKTGETFAMPTLHENIGAVVELNSEYRHRITLAIEDDVEVYSVTDGEQRIIEHSSRPVSFDALPGEYLIIKKGKTGL